MKEKWFQHIVGDRNLWSQGFTLKRLDKIKDDVFADENIMWDLLGRHNGKDYSPEQMKELNWLTYNHAVGNFSCNILYKMMEKGIIKNK